MRPFPADYTHSVLPDGSIHITDLDLGNKSVTNDVEGVLADLKKLGLGMLGATVTYTDSMGQVDEIVHENGVFKGFAPWRP